MKKFICGVIATACVIGCSGCATTTKDMSLEDKVIYGHFTVVQMEKEGVQVCYTVYDNNTGVMYYILSAPKFDAGSSAISPIYDEYGNICTYDSDIH